MTPVPAELEEIVWQAASAPVAVRADVEAVRRRAHIRQRRRRGRVAVATAALIVAGVATAPAVFSDGSPRPPQRAPLVAAASPTRATATVPPAQRLVPLFGGVTWEIAGKQVGLVPDGIKEVLPDGSLRELTVPDVDTVQEIVALPDGRLVAQGLVDLMPGVPRTDGPDVEGLSFPLVVVDPDGTVRHRREIRVKGEDVSLVGANDHAAYLRRDQRLVEHDLATGAERVVVSRLPDPQTQIDVAGDMAVLGTARKHRACAVVLVELRSGSQREIARVDGACHNLGLSPDGGLLALADSDGPTGVDEPYVLKATIIELATGAVRAEEVVAESLPGARGAPKTAAMAWTDNRTVRVAVAPLPANPDRVYSLDEVLQVVSVTAR